MIKLPAIQARTYLRSHFLSVEGSQIKTPDGSYAVPTRRWVEDVFTSHMSAYLSAYGVNFWQNETFDCDNFALEFVVEAQKAHVLSKGSRDSALAVGFFWFNCRGSGGITPGYHAAAAAIVGNTDSNKIEVITLEPQNGWTTNLTIQERESCDFIYM